MCRVTCVTATLAAASRQEGRLLHYALHRAIALRTQTCFKEGAGAATGAATALVRLLDQRFAEGHQLPCSAAARALATCAARPRPPSAAAASVHASLRTVATYSPVAARAADAALFATFAAVNDLAGEAAAARGAANAASNGDDDDASHDDDDDIGDEERERRAPLGEDSGGYDEVLGYSPGSVRRVAAELLPGATWADAVGRALVLGHCGAARRQQEALAGRTLESFAETLMPWAAREGRRQQRRCRGSWPRARRARGWRPRRGRRLRTDRRTAARRTRPRKASSPKRVSRPVPSFTRPPPGSSLPSKALPESLTPRSTIPTRTRRRSRARFLPNSALRSCLPNLRRTSSPRWGRWKR